MQLFVPEIAVVCMRIIRLLDGPLIRTHKHTTQATPADEHVRGAIALWPNKTRRERSPLCLHRA